MSRDPVKTFDEFKEQLIALRSETSESTQTNSWRVLFETFDELKQDFISHQTFVTFASGRGLDENMIGNGYFSVLPDECILHVFSFLDMKDLLSVITLNQTLGEIAKDNMFWRDRTLKKWPRLGKRWSKMPDGWFKKYVELTIFQKKYPIVW